MALGKRSSSMNETGSAFSLQKEEERKLGFEVLSYTRLCGSKRVYLEATPSPSPSVKMGEIFDWETQKLSPLESLPQDILVKIACGVDHDDLKQLTHVSKTTRDAGMIAKEWHFEYRTPKKARVFRTSIDCVVSSEEIEAPNAPKQVRSRELCSGGKDLSEISVALFASPRRKGLFTETAWRWNV